MTATTKVPKPYDGFPLFTHATGRWAKKVRGKFRYFGKVTGDGDHGAQAALEKWLDQRDDLQAGRTPRPLGDGLSIRDLLNRFLTVKQKLLDGGELTRRSFADYRLTCARIASNLGLTRLVVDLTANDFEHLRANIARTWGCVRLGNEIQRIRSVFRYALDAGLIDRPVRFGTAFRKPSARVLRLARKAAGSKMFEAEEVRKMIESAGTPLRAAILLGVNCGFGNADVATLPVEALDLAGGWVNYHRPKTGIDRRCSLWPETVAALREALAARPAPRDASAAKLVFLGPTGVPWPADRGDQGVGRSFGRLLRELGLYRRGIGFYALRHSFSTAAGGCRDQVAVDAVMGHAPHAGDMGAVYRERLDDERLVAVAEHVRKWLFGSQEQQTR